MTTGHSNSPFVIQEHTIGPIDCRTIVSYSHHSTTCNAIYQICLENFLILITLSVIFKEWLHSYIICIEEQLKHSDSGPSYSLGKPTFIVKIKIQEWCTQWIQAYRNNAKEYLMSLVWNLILIEAVNCDVTFCKQS